MKKLQGLRAWWREWRPPGYATALIGLGLAMFVGLGIAGWVGVQEVSAATAHRKSLLELQVLTQRTLRLLVDVESGQRGFVLTGREDFLEPYQRAIDQLNRAYPALQRRLAPLLGDQWPRTHGVLDELVQRRLVIAEENIAARRRNAYDGDRDLAFYVMDKHVMDQLRGQFDELFRFEKQQIEEDTRRVGAVQSRTRGLSLLLIAFGTAMLVAAVALLIYERRMRDQAEGALRKINVLLERLVEERTRNVQAALGRIQSFAAELDANVEAERRRLAREVHDQFGQIATGMKMIVISMAKATPELPSMLVVELLGLLDQAVAMARRFAAELRPPLLDDLGFSAAVEHYADTTSATGQILFEVDVRDEHQLAAAQANQLFRILQEAVTNILRHAKASEVRIEGRVEGDSYTFRIVDNGVGPGEGRTGSSGLRNMRERAALAGGTLTFGAAEMRGSEVKVVIPFERAEEPMPAMQALPVN